jgi:hypothetical protein
VSISSMTSAALARRDDYAPRGVPVGLAGVAAAAVGQPMLLLRPPAAPRQPLAGARMPTPPAQPGAFGTRPSAPAQPSISLPVPPAQPTAPGSLDVPATRAPLTTAAGGVTAALQVITTYIPTEILTLYVAVLAALRDPKVTTGASAASANAAAGGSANAETAFWVFLVLTPIAVWLVYAAKLRAAEAGRPLPADPGAWPVWEMFAATLAYVAWAVALPDSPFPSVPQALGAVIVLTTSTLLGLAAPVFQQPIKAPART